MAPTKKTICIDFDGTIAEYKHWQGKGNFGKPLEGVGIVLKALRAMEWIIIVHTTRSETGKVSEYMRKHDLPFDYINYNPENIEQGCQMGKPLATVYVDDRAIRYDGNWLKTFEEIRKFKTWYED